MISINLNSTINPILFTMIYFVLNTKTVVETTQFHKMSHKKST